MKTRLLKMAKVDKYWNFKNVLKCLSTKYECEFEYVHMNMASKKSTLTTTATICGNFHVYTSRKWRCSRSTAKKSCSSPVAKQQQQPRVKLLTVEWTLKEKKFKRIWISRRRKGKWDWKEVEEYPELTWVKRYLKVILALAIARK